jgi:FKBP-type peptidyl-prolyl cis-trans isomerase SlyD
MKVSAGRFVRIELEIRDEEGEVVLTTDEEEPIEYLHGGEDLPLPGLERELEGKEAGAELEVSLSPEDAFGEYDLECLLSIPRSALPPDAEIVPGDIIPVELESDEGAPMGEVEMRVESLAEGAVVLDANHPLAGVAVTCRARVLEVREPGPDEV